jgi:peptide/nickel transport system permease protein
MNPLLPIQTWLDDHPDLQHWLYNLVPLLVVVGIALALKRSLRQPLWAEAYRRIRRQPKALAAIAVIGLYGLVAFCDSLGTYDAKSQERVTVLDRICSPLREKERYYSAPFAKTTTGEAFPKPIKGVHVLGTDGKGDDVLYRTLKGARTAFVIGGLTSLLTIPVGIVLGLLAGFYSGTRFKWVDDLITYVYTVVSSIPSILLQIAFVMVLGKAIVNICIALGMARWVGLCRQVRGETLRHREREYVRGARALGVSTWGVLTRHILPNLLPTVIIYTTLGVSGLILSEAILSYLGVGVDSSAGSWGNMINAARDELAREPIIWWNLSAAFIAMLGIVMAFNILGDALRDAIDPRLRS